jgi:hypothetical protein
MANRRYSQKQTEKQMANAVKKQNSIPTNGSQKKNEDVYNEVDASSVPSEPQAFEKFINACTQYGSWIAWTITLAGAIGAFLNFQSDLKRAESDIKGNQTNIEKNTDKSVELDKFYIKNSQNLKYMSNNLSDLKQTVVKIDNKLDLVSDRQLNVEFKVKTAAKQINKD